LEKLEPLISQKNQTCLFQLETRLTDELNFKNKYELLKIELETCKTEQFVVKVRLCELLHALDRRIRIRKWLLLHVVGSL